jgi:hypothetical protein
LEGNGSAMLDACGVVYIRVVHAPIPGLYSLYYGISTAAERLTGPRGEGYAFG